MPEAKTLPDWIVDQQATRGPAHFDLLWDKKHPQTIKELEAVGIKLSDPLTQYDCALLSFIAQWDAHYAINESRVAVRADGSLRNHICKAIADKTIYGSSLDPNGSGKRGWIEYEQVELTPENPTKKGETVTINGRSCVCIEEQGCTKLRSGQVESGKFRCETFHARPEGAGADQATKDGFEIYEKLRGYKPG